MKPTAKELATARKTLGSNVEAAYERLGLAHRVSGRWELTRLGCIAFACARFVEGQRELPASPGHVRRMVAAKQPAAVAPWKWTLLDEGYVREQTAGQASAPIAIVSNGFRLTAKGQQLATLTGLRPLAIPAPAESGVRLVAKKRAA